MSPEHVFDSKSAQNKTIIHGNTAVGLCICKCFPQSASFISVCSYGQLGQ